jgi:hypothetical protein
VLLREFTSIKKFYDVWQKFNEINLLFLGRIFFNAGEKPDKLGKLTQRERNVYNHACNLNKIKYRKYVEIHVS